MLELWRRAEDLSACRPPPLCAEPDKINGLGHNEGEMDSLLDIVTSGWSGALWKAESHADNRRALRLVLGCFQKEERLLGPESRTTIPGLVVSTFGSFDRPLINHPVLPQIGS